MTTLRFIESPPALEQTVIGVILTTDAGQTLQLLFSADCLLDLSAVDRIVGGRLHIAPRAPKAVLLDIGGQNAETGNIFGAPTFVDQRLAQHSQWMVSTELGMVELPQAELLRHLPRHANQTIATPLALIDRNASESTEDLLDNIQSLTGRRIRKRLDETLELPPLPHTATEIVRLKLDPNAGLDELADVVETDPSLAAQVVSWANSPYYAAPGQIHSVSDAVIRVLGYEMVINLALGLSLGQAIAPPKGKRGEPSFWTQSVYTAALMDALSRSITGPNRPNSGLAYLAGLLFNFGHLVLTHVFPNISADIERTIGANPHLPPRYVDLHLMSLAREQLGAELLSGWNLPAAVTDALRYQHLPEQEHEFSQYSQLLFVATRLLASKGMVSGIPPAIPNGLLDQLGLTHAQAQTALDSVIGARDSLSAMAQDLEK